MFGSWGHVVQLFNKDQERENHLLKNVNKTCPWQNEWRQLWYLYISISTDWWIDR